MIELSAETLAALKSDSCTKHFVVSFPNGERGNITESDIAWESVSFTESICSGDTLEFGLCEANVLTFTTVNVEDLTGYIFDAKYVVNGEDIPLGRYMVSSCKLSAVDYPDTRKVTAYGQSPAIEWDVNPVEELKKTLRSYSDSSAYNYDHMCAALSCIDNPDLTWWTSDAAAAAGRSFLEYSAWAAAQGGGYHDWETETHTETLWTSDDGTQSLIVRAACKKLVTMSDGNGSSSYPRQKCTGVNNLLYVQTGDPRAAQIVADLRAAAELHGIDADTVAERFATLGYLVKPSWWGISYTQKVGKARHFQEVLAAFDPNSFVYPYWQSTVSVGTTVTVDKRDGTSVSQAYKDSFSIHIPQELDFYLTENGTETVLFSDEVYTTAPVVYVASLGIVGYTQSVGRAADVAGNGAYALKTTEWGSTADSIKWLCAQNASFGRYRRSTELFEMFTLNDTTPACTITMHEYSSAAVEESISKKYRAVQTEYRHNYGEDTDPNNCDVADDYTIIETDATDPTSAEPSGLYQVYDLSDAWASYTEPKSKTYVADSLARWGAAVNNIQYQPCELSGIGRPDLEAGDYIDIETPRGKIHALIMRRTLSGLQCMTDSIESKAGAVNRYPLSTSYYILDRSALDGAAVLG